MEDATIIEVVTFDGSRDRIDRAEALTPEEAIFAGQTLYDDAFRGRHGRNVSVGFYVDDRLVRLVTGRPEGGLT